MAWTDLKAAVAAVIKTNGNQEITGALLQSTLNSIIDQVGANASYKGVAIPSTIPGTPDGPLFYLASQAGTYANFGGAVIEKYSLNILSYSGGSWGLVKIFESPELLADLGSSETKGITQKKITEELTGIKNRFTNGQKPGISLPNSIMSNKIPMSFGNFISAAGVSVGDIDLTDELTSMGITRAAYRTKSSFNIEIYPSIGSAFVPPQGSYLWKSYFLYCSHPIASVPSTRHRILIFYTDATQEPIIGDVTIHKIRNGFFQVVGKHLIPTNAKTISYIWVECVFETDNSIPSGSICAVTGIDVQYSVSDNLVPRDGIVYSKIKELETEMVDLSETVEIATKDKISIVSDVVDGALEDPTLRNYSAPGTIINQTNPILNGFGLYKYHYANKSTNVEVYYWFYPGAGLTNEITNKFISYNGKYCKIRYYVYTKSGVFPVTQNAGRLGISCNTSAGAFAFVGSNSALNGGYEITKITDEVYRLDKVFKIEFTGTINYIFAATVWEAAIIPVDYVNGDFGVTGLSMKFGETAEELNIYSVIGDWEKQITPAEVSGIVDDKLELIQLPEVYNNIPFNLSKISPFLIKHQMREVDEFNQLSITMVGDSILGRVDKASFTPATAEISLTPDTNGGVGNGYVTGHFPPNMWEQVVGYKVLQDLQFPHADVKYYNHVASEIVKTGTWIDRFPVGADCIRTATMESLNANAVLTFGGASFVKFIYSGYGFNPATRKIKVTFSDDNGVTWKTPSQLSLTESIVSDAEGSGIYYIPAVQHKWGNFIWGGLNKTTNYKIKVEKLESVGTVNVWGFETWSNPRVNVIVTAEGGNIAASQITRWERFYSKFYQPSLIIYELPYLNDLGTGMIQRFKGNITSLSSNPGTPVLNDFWHSNVAGTLTNFGGLTVLIGDYIEWNGTSWVHDSTELKTQLNKYKEDNETVFKRLATLGCPVLTLITHNSNGWVTSRPFAPKEGLTILRNLVSKYGFASIDLNYYQMNFGYATGMYSDGTHLNDTGVELYRLLIAKLLKINPDKRFVGASEGVVYKKRTGSGSGAGTIAFGFEFATTPTVRIYGNSGITISSITQSGFTVTGSGAYDWEAYIN